MGRKLGVEVLRPGELGAPEREAWARYVAASPQLDSPYFDLRYALAADGVVPGARVAVLHRGGRLVGFLPFQKRRGVLQPLAAPLTDYHGLIAAPGEAPDLAEVVRALGGGVFRFGGLKTDARPAGAVALPSMVADVSGGLETYVAGKPKLSEFLKKKARVALNFAKEHGELEFRFSDDADLFGFVTARKRAQYRETRRHDIFACGWTEAFLRRLWEERTPDFGGAFCSLYVGGELVAAEYDLRGGGVRHVWFPAFDPAYSRFGPGVQMMIRSVSAAAEDPAIRVVDFGPDHGGFKHIYAEPGDPVYEGELAAGPLARAALAPLKPLGAVRDRLRRRFDIIDACETTARGWAVGAIHAFRTAPLRRVEA